MGLSYFLTALMIEAINFMMPLALIIGLLCKNLKMSIIVALAVGIVGALQTYVGLMPGHGWPLSLVHLRVVAKFIDLAVVVLLVGLIKQVVTRRVLNTAAHKGEVANTKVRIALSLAGIIVGMIAYFISPPVGVGIILGSFFMHMRYAALAGLIWTAFYITVLYYAFFYSRHIQPPAGWDILLWIPWDAVVIGWFLPPVTTFVKQFLAKKLGARLTSMFVNQPLTGSKPE